MVSRTRWSLRLAAVVAALAAVSCGSGSSPTGPGGSQVTMSNLAFAPGTMTVSVNTTVTWMNADSVTHTATSDTGSTFAFDTGNIAAGATSKGVTFTQMGTFAYHCNFHPSMHGTIVVQ
jgi:plastocyanin